MSDYSSSNYRIAKNTVFLSIRMIVVLAINLFTTRNVLQALGVVDYGIYNVVCGFVAMFSFLNTSMSNGIQRYFNYEYGKNGEDGANKVYNTSIYIQLILAILVVVFVELIGIWYLQNKIVIPLDRLNAAKIIFQCSVIMFVMGILQAPFLAAVTAHEKMDFFAIVSVIDSILKFGISLVIVHVAYDGLILYGLLMTLACIITFVLYFVYCKKNFTEIYFKPTFDKNMFKSMLGFSGWNLFGSFSGVIVDQGINLVLNSFFGPVINAAHGIAIQINGAVQSFVVNIGMPIRPQVTQSYARGEIHRVMSLTYSVSKITCAIVLMLAIPMALEMDFLLYIWLGNNVPDHTSTFAIIILATSLITNLNWATSGVVHATGYMRNYQIFGSLLRMSALPISILALKWFSIPEISLISVLVCQFLAHMVGLFILKSLIEFSILDYINQIIIPLLIIMVISLILLFCIHMMLPSGWIRLFSISLSSVLIVGVLFYLFALSSSERLAIKSFIKTRLIKTL